MMEASVVTQDSGHTTPLTAALDASPLPPSSSSPAPPPDPVPPSPPAPSQPPARPRRPKPPPPSLKSCRPPLPPSAPPSLPPPLPPVSKPLFPPPPGLPPPLSPTPASPSPSISPQLAVSSELTPTFSPPPLPPPLSPTVPSSSCSTPPPPPPSLVPPSSPTPPPLSPIDRVVGSAPVWRLKGLSQEQTTVLLGKETPGVFVVLGSDDDGMKLLLRQPEGDGTPPVHELDVKRHKTFLHLDGSCLVFDDIFKMICFYSVSRDVLAVPLRLPMAITTATKREELEVISAMGADFWTSDMNQQAKDRDPVSDQDYGGLYLHLDPVLVEEKLKPSQPAKSISKPETTKPETTTPQTVSSSLQNGEPPQQPTPEVKGQTKTVPHPDIKYKRPPPRRPPSLSSGSGMGLLFSSPPPVHSGSSSADRKEEGKGGAGVEREERKSASVSPPPSRPPVPPQGRAGPPLPPAPLRRTSSRTGSDKEGTEREKGRDSARKNEKEAEGGEETGSRSALTGEGGGGGKSQEEEEVRKEKEGEEEEEKQKPAKKPSRPVPPPRRKPCGPNQPAGSIHQGPTARGAAAVAAAAPPPRRPDVSLYSPQGGAVLGTDPDSCSTSSTEEEGEVNQEQEQNHTRPAESKVTVKRTPTTVMLDRARYRLSTVLTGLISHDRRLTQRIVEVARDPLSYFGNLVKEHRAFTLETMSNHATSTELLQEIRQMMTQLKSYLLQSTELQAMLEPQHQYTQDKLENIVEAALCKSVLKPLREPIYQSLEKLHANNSGLKQLAQNQSVVLGSTTTALGITTAVPEASAMEKISIKLNNLHLEYSPQKKIELLLKACKIIYDSMSVSSPGRSHGADDFLPVMMYVLARSNLSDLQLDVEYMMELMDPALTLGEGSYYLTTTYGALEHIKTFDQQRTATRQLSREVQDSIHRWERRRTLNQERMSQGSVRDFLTVCCPEIGTNPKTLGVLPTTTIQQLTEQCAARFEQDSYVLSLYMDDVHQPLAPTEMALSVKSSCQPGSYCFVFHPVDRPSVPPVRNCPTDPPPAPPTHVCYQPVAEETAAIADDDAADEEPVAEAEDSLISL